MRLQAKIINQKKSGLCPVYVVCYIAGDRVRFLTGVECLYTEFDHAAGAVKAHVKNAKDKNLLINHTKKLITEIETRYRLQNKPLTADALKNEFTKPNYNTSFISFAQVELKNKKSGLSAAMYEKYDITIKKIQRFRPDVSLTEIDDQFISEFTAYCKKLGNCQNTINANLKNIKFFIRLAEKRKLITDNVFNHYRISQIKPLRNFLTETELKKFCYYYSITYNRVHRTVLQSFIFSCFTGLRFSDVENLKFDNIQDGFLVLKPIKTSYIDKTVRVPLCRQASELIDYSRKTRHVFTMYCSQYTNRELKNIADLLGIKKNITFHVARHTFATLYLRKTKDLTGLQKILGHANISETTTYLHLLDDDLRENIKIFDFIDINL